MSNTKDRKQEGQSTKRRVWDRDEYAQKAQEREAAQRITEVPKSMLFLCLCLIDLNSCEDFI